MVNYLFKIKSVALIKSKNIVLWRYKTVLLSKSALTLTELMVATTLMGIVMVGTVAFTSTIKNMQTSTNYSVILASRVANLAKAIKADTNLAVGDVTNPGIINAETIGAPEKSICLRQDVSDPSIYSDDEWVCYFLDPATNEINRYENVPQAVIPCVSIIDCSSGGGEYDFLAPLELTASQFYTVNTNASGEIVNIDYTVSAIYDGNRAADPVNNPTTTVDFSVNPIGHSRR